MPFAAPAAIPAKPKLRTTMPEGKRNLTSVHFGDVGDRVTLLARVNAILPTKGNPIYFLETERGNSAPLWGRGVPETVVKGDWLEVVATVDKHDVYDGEHQTWLSHAFLKKNFGPTNPMDTETAPAAAPAAPPDEWTPVSSSNIEAVGYDPATEILRIKFKAGSAFAYAGVTPDIHSSLMAADSIGSFYSRNIRGKFPSTKL